MQPSLVVVFDSLRLLQIAKVTRDLPADYIDIRPIIGIRLNGINNFLFGRLRLIILGIIR
jgi:hypothetical protein